MALMTNRLLTTGMHCSSCSMLVDMTLQEMEGVAESRTDHATGVTVVSYDTDVVTADEIIQAIRRIGYDAELQD